MEATRFRKTALADSFGDANVLPSWVTFAGEAAATAIDFIQLPAGTEVIDIKVINDALGASSTIAYGYRYIDSTNGSAAPAAFLAAASTATAGSRSGAFHPITFSHPIAITGITAGAAVTGKVTVMVSYRYIGPN